VLAALLTLVVFSTICAQVVLAFAAFKVSIPFETVLTGIPALLISSLVPVSFLGLTGKELGLAWVYPSLSPSEAIATASLLALTSLLGPSLWWLLRGRFKSRESHGSEREIVVVRRPRTRGAA
ncbi:MAG: hypothetical protein AAF658_08960, partial [Myxococcota bacterium]